MRKTNTAVTKPKKIGSTGPALPYRWSAAEYVPRKRWWWFIGLGYIVFALTFLLVALGNWSAAALTVVLGIAFFVLYIPKPRVWKYELTRKELRVTGNGKKLTWPLDGFRAFTVEEIQRGKNLEPFVSLLLLPRRRLQPARDLYLTGELEHDIEIAEALASVLPYDEATSYRTGVRFIDWLARIVRLG